MIGVFLSISTACWYPGLFRSSSVMTEATSAGSTAEEGEEGGRESLTADSNTSSEVAARPNPRPFR